MTREKVRNIKLFTCIIFTLLLFSCDTSPSIQKIIDLKKRREGNRLCSLFYNLGKNINPELTSSNRDHLARACAEALLSLGNPDDTRCLGQFIFRSDLTMRDRLMLLELFGRHQQLPEKASLSIRRNEGSPTFQKALIDSVGKAAPTVLEDIAIELFVQAKEVQKKSPYHAIQLLKKANSLNKNKEFQTNTARFLYSMHKSLLGKYASHSLEKASKHLQKMKEITCTERARDSLLISNIEAHQEKLLKFKQRGNSASYQQEDTKRILRKLLSQLGMINIQLEDTYRIRAYIIDRVFFVPGNTYEISFNLWRANERALLRTNKTNFTTKGWFSMWVKKIRIMNVTLKNGSIKRIPLFEEFQEGNVLETLVQDLKRRVLLTKSKIESLQREEKQQKQMMHREERNIKRFMNQLANIRILNAEKKSTVSAIKETPSIKTKHPVGMLFIPTGCFLIGSSEGDADEQPRKNICLQPFWMDRTEVTTAQYRQCVRAGKCRRPKRRRGCNWYKPNKENHPINCVSWYDAKTYCRWRKKLLPTEAQWEYAARGHDGRRYPWGNSPQASCQMTVMYQGGGGCGREGTWPVGNKPLDKSPFGVLDMAGNVMEWTADCYSASFYQKITSTYTKNVQKRCRYRTIRGSDWNDSKSAYFRSANRDKIRPKSKERDLGFRCMKEL